MKKITALALVAALSLSACGAAEETPNGQEDVLTDGKDPSPPAQDGTVSAYYDYGDWQTVKVVTIDGRTCFLYDGESSGGIWCENSGLSMEATDGFE